MGFDSLRKKFEESNAPQEGDRSLMCKAHGCPNRWSVDLGGGGMCSRHAWVDPSKWGQVTREMASEASLGYPGTEVRELTRNDKLEILRRLQNIGRNPSRVWAEALREREQSGERLTPFQKSAWREALGVRE